MEKIYFINDLWIKFLQKIYLKSNINLYFFLFFWMYIKKYIYIYFFYILYQSLKYKYIFFVFLQLKKQSQLNKFFEKKFMYIKKKYIQKGYKINKLGIYIKNLENNLKNYKTLDLAYYFLIRFNRKNLFLTLLNNTGNVLCKTNIGSCGFKKKVKSTGYAIKWTSKIFLEKITKFLINNIYNVYYIKKKKKKKKIITKFIDFITNKYKLKLKKKKNYYNKIKLKFKIEQRRKKKIKKAKKKEIWRNGKRYVRVLKKKYKFILKKRKILKVLKKKKKYKLKRKKNIFIIENKNKINLFFKKFKLLNYRNYYEYLKLFLKNKLKITFRIKSTLKFWGFRFITYSLAKSFFWFRNLEIRLPIAHSTSLRLKKKRRI